MGYEGGGLPALLGLELVSRGDGWSEMAMEISSDHFRPGIAGLHAGAVVTLADTACGFGCRDALPEGAKGFITLELKTNLIGTATEGQLICRAEAEHKGRTTQVWAATVRHEGTGKTLAKFSCTQLILY